MILRFKYGFEYNGFLYGWLKKELYRLPSETNNRSYPLKKLKEIMIGNKVGYRIKRDKFTIEQLGDRTIFIDKEIHKIQDDDLPF